MPKPPRDLAVVLIVVHLLLALPNVASAERARGRGKFEPPDGKVLVLIGCEWDDIYQTYKKVTGDTPAGGVFWYEFNGDTNFFWHNAREVVGENGVLHVNFNLVSNTGGSLRPYLKGEKDEAIRKIGLAFKTWGHPLYVTLGTECDHPGNKGYTPQEFVAVYRKIRKTWDGLGVTNVAYVWHLIGNDGNPRWASYYPGVDYVDWVAFSFYWFEKDLPHVGEIARLARKHRKPVMIAESGPYNGKANSWEDWHGPFLNHASGLGVKAICYNNWREPPVDRVFHNSAFDRLPRPIAEAWGRAMRSPTYLHASPALYETLGVQAQAVAPPADEPTKGMAERGTICIRQIALSLDERGVGELVVDTRTENPDVTNEPAGTMALAGVPNARAVPKGGNSYTITHLFKEHEGASDFALLAGVVPLKQEGLAIDREAGTLILTPARRDGRAGMTAKLHYPRLLRPPLKLAIDVAEFERGTLVLSFKPQAPSVRPTGTFAVNVSPRFGPDDATMMSAAWRPDVGGKPGDWMNLLEQGVRPDRLIKRAFRLPAGSISGEHRIPLEVGVAGGEPVSLGRLEVEGVVVPMIGVGFDQGDGGARATSISPGGPAEKAGLEAGDVVTAIDGQGIAKFAEAMSRVGRARIGQEMKFKIRRGGQTKVIVVKPE